MRDVAGSAFFPSPWPANEETLYDAFHDTRSLAMPSHEKANPA
jgi:hypothetical protein